MERWAVITGATGGIGGAFAERLRAEGFQLLLVGRRDAELHGLKQRYPEAETFACELADRADTLRLCERVRELGDAVDTVVANAGTISPGPFAEQPLEEFERVVEVSLHGSVRVIHAALPQMIARGSGTIIANVSLGGIIALENYTGYSAAKFGMRGFLWSLWSEVRDKGVDVIGVYPGAIDTPMLREEARHPHGSALNFMGTPRKPMDVADAALKARGTDKLEVYLPYTDSLLSRGLAWTPRWLRRIGPKLVASGEKGRKRYLQSIDEADRENA